MSSSVNVLSVKSLKPANSGRVPVFVDGIQVQEGTTAQRTAASVSKGAMFYDTTLEQMHIKDSGSWRTLDAPAACFVAAASPLTVASGGSGTNPFPTSTSPSYVHRIATEDDSTDLFFYPHHLYGDGLVNIKGTIEAGAGVFNIYVGNFAQLNKKIEVSASNNTEFSWTFCLSDLTTRHKTDLTDTGTGIVVNLAQSSGGDIDVTGFTMAIVQFNTGTCEHWSGV